MSGLCMSDEKLAIETQRSAAAQRQAARRSVYYSAVLTIRELNMRCRVKDLSPVGALIETSVPLWAPVECTLDVPKIGKITGALVWSDGKRSGLAFDRMLDPLDIADLFDRPLPQRSDVLPKDLSSPVAWRPSSVVGDHMAHDRARNAIGWLRSQKNDKRR